VAIEEGFLLGRGAQFLKPLPEERGQIDPFAVGIVLDDDAEDLVVEIAGLGCRELADDRRA